MGIASRLKLISFLQYFIWGSRLVTLGSYMINALDFIGANVDMTYSPKGLAAIAISSTMDIIADKWLRAECAYMLYHLACAGVLLYTIAVTDSQTIFWVMLINAVAYVPTIVLSSSVSYSCLTQSGQDPITVLPPIRVFGTIGFIVAVWTVSLAGLELSGTQLYIASGTSLLLALYAPTLPKIPVVEKKANTTSTSKLGLDAFVLLKKPQMAISFLFVVMLGAVLQITNVPGNPFLHDSAHNPGFVDSFVTKYPSILLSVSQMVEVGFILTIPYFLKRFGIKAAMLMSVLTWTLRLDLFAFGDPLPFGSALLLMSVIVCGCAFDFLNIPGPVFVEQEISSNIRANAQGSFTTMVNSVGTWVGSTLSGVTADYFSVDGVKDQQTIWLVFATYALALAVIFILFFKYKHEPK